ncbi:hypothetical protein AAHU71_02275 [Klebsiella pneumoniae]|nr:hypothetical protein [Klebsiella pneumoniae]
MPDAKTYDVVLNDAVRYQSALEKISTIAAAGEYIAGDGDMHLSFQLFDYIEMVASQTISKALSNTDKE